MRIAIISDIHGNLEALKTVLEDIKKRGIDKIYCLGDIIAKGSHLQECVDLVRENCEVVVKGNCDLFFSREHDYNEYNEKFVKVIKYHKSKMNEETMNYLINLPYCYEFYLSGRLVRLVHAHPEDIYKFVGNIDRLENFYSLFLPSENTISQEKADILVYGHIHTPYVQKIYNRYILNAGSVGNSLDVFRNDSKDGNLRNTSLANYLILSGILNSKDLDHSFSFEIVNVSYNIEKELENSSDNLEFDALAKELNEGIYRDTNRLNKTLVDRGIDKDSI